MAEQRYQAVLAVTAGGVSVTEVAAKVGVSRQTGQSRLGHPSRKAKALLADVDRPPAGLPVGVGVLQLLDLVLQFLDVALDGDDVAADVFQRIQVGVAAIAQRVEDGF